MHPLVIVIGSQALFTVSDLLGRWAMKTHGFTPGAFLRWWFAGYMLVRTLATFGQLYVFSSVTLGRTAALFAATSVVLNTLLGLLVLRESLSLAVACGVALALAALAVLALAR
jgi:multidrug transporter EmrE-like cation transporter